MDRALDRLRVDAQGEGQTGLRVEVDQQHRQPLLGERAPSEPTVVVLATPPFWLATATTQAFCALTPTFCPGGSTARRSARCIGQRVAAIRRATSSSNLAYVSGSVMFTPRSWSTLPVPW